MHDLNTVLKLHREETLRWNKQFSLISRIDPEKEIDALLTESVSAFEEIQPMLTNALGEADIRQIYYYDIGSGGGFPGLEWSCLLQSHDWPGTPSIKTVVVEPRSKRAWFLDRVARLAGDSAMAVIESRWEDVPPLRELPGHSIVLVSLKAIKLADEKIKPAGSPGPRVLVCRFVNNPQISPSPILETNWL
jgi:16S rRNA G527 N7-methylase RsmG